MKFFLQLVTFLFFFCNVQISIVKGQKLCPSNIAVTHVKGELSAETKDINYAVIELEVSGKKQCWLAQNLGADSKVNAVGRSRKGENVTGWFWQFNKRKGHAVVNSKFDNWKVSIEDNSDWEKENDPCFLLLGGLWRIPTREDWRLVGERFNNINEAQKSELGIYKAGFFNCTTGVREGQNEEALFWARDQVSDLSSGCWYFYEHNSVLSNNLKSYGFNLRCVLKGY